MDAHSSGEVTMKLMVFRLRTQDPDAEGGIWKGFLHNADELYDILRHKDKYKGNGQPRGCRAGISYKSPEATARKL